MKINNIFRSIQGESSYSGLPCVFIRLTGCNLRCSYCDTKYAYNEGKEMDIKEVFNEIKKHYVKGDIIEFTGGEPLLQKKELGDLILLIREKLSSKCTILVETNGAILLPKENHPLGDDIFLTWNTVVFIMDWKLPSSGMTYKMKKENLSRLKKIDELKFVIGDMNDYDNLVDLLYKDNPHCTIIISTVWNKFIKREQIVERMLKDKINARFQIQLHKLIWSPKKRGV